MGSCDRLCAHGHPCVGDPEHDIEHTSPNPDDHHLHVWRDDDPTCYLVPPLLPNLEGTP